MLLKRPTPTKLRRDAILWPALCLAWALSAGARNMMEGVHRGQAHLWDQDHAAWRKANCAQDRTHLDSEAHAQLVALCSGDRAPRPDTTNVTFPTPDWNPKLRSLERLDSADSIDELYHGSVPRWMDECNLRTKRNQLLKAMGAPWPRQVTIEGHGDEKNVRPKRSVSQEQPAEVQTSDHPLVFKRAKAGPDQHWRNKKTSFAFSKAKLDRAWPGHKTGKPAWSKNRQFVSDTAPQGRVAGEYLVGPLKSDLPVTLPPNLTEIDLEVPWRDRDVTHMLQLNILINLHIQQALGTVQGFLKHIQQLLDLIPSQHTVKRDLSNRRREEILSQRGWMPKIEELTSGGPERGLVKRSISNNVTSGLNHEETQTLVSNMTRYLELFCVAVEQMEFDRYYFNDEANLKLYQDLQEDAQAVLCQAKSLLSLLAGWQEGKKKVIQWHKGLKPAEKFLQPFYFQLMDQTLVRDHPIDGDIQRFESPLERAWLQLDANQRERQLRQIELFLPENKMNPPKIRRHLKKPSHFWRSIMPATQRKLVKAEEREIRDVSILEDMEVFLGAYKSLLENNLYNGHELHMSDEEKKMIVLRFKDSVDEYRRKNV